MDFLPSHVGVKFKVFSCCEHLFRLESWEQEKNLNQYKVLRFYYDFSASALLIFWARSICVVCVCLLGWGEGEVSCVL